MVVPCVSDCELRPVTWRNRVPAYNNKKRFLYLLYAVLLLPLFPCLNQIEGARVEGIIDSLRPHASFINQLTTRHSVMRFFKPLTQGRSTDLHATASRTGKLLPSTTGCRPGWGQFTDKQGVEFVTIYIAPHWWA
ncbi:hypothetical protein PCH_Pc21g13200 [Penicillium rubens Wisconsin 54-1255]|uniref:Uncharacterized protein n=1 Tax=Penicillium rubens (strain ATCC 28089 / DSM 1075 / NRRL 1951 / Wisconsin 54-1255) TaxID=500485 RepID=B6HMG8_PENRW|nr:hypothetical protein PCH_Pc21g13200 [Penicillium rubens Wisconsin 54-1255]